MRYKDQYKSIQVNVSKSKYQDMLDWLKKEVVRQNRSINSFIVYLLLEEFKRWQEKQNIQ